MKNNIPTVSIIIPIYNSSQFVLKTLISLEAQSYKNYEIVLINDGSTDNSLDILMDYKKNRNNIILYSQKNSGVSAARNKGVELANGNFVTFLDSDDIYSPTFLEKMLARQKEKDANIVYCGFNRISFSGKSSPIYNSFMEGNILNPYLHRNGYFHFSGMLIRKSILKANSINFEIGSNISEDLLFTVKLLSNFNCYCVKDYLFNYVQRPGSIMSSLWSKDKWLADIRGRQQILLYLLNNYTKADKQEIVKLASALVFQREISYLIDCIKKLKYKEITFYLNETNFLSKKYLFEQNKLNYKDKKKFKIIIKKNRIYWFIYTLYYRFFRFKF